MQNALFAPLLAIIGAALTAAIVLFPYRPSEFGNDPEFIVWAFFVAAQNGFSAIVFLPVLRSGLRLLKYLSYDKIPIAVSLVTFGVLVAVPSVIGRYYTPDIPVDKEAIPFVFAKVLVITVIILLVAALPITTALMVNNALGATIREVTHIQRKLRLYIRLRTDLQRAGFVLGVLFGLGMLTAGAFFDLRVVNTPNVNTQKELVVLYAAYLSFVTAVIYVPVYVRLLAFGRDILDAMVPLPPPSSDNWMEIYSKRKTVEGFLQLSVTSGPGVQAGIPILVPLIGGSFHFCYLEYDDGLESEGHRPAAAQAFRATAPAESPRA